MADAAEMHEGLQFDPLTHTYTMDGEVLPSVTEIIRPLQDYAAIPERVLEYARQKGEAIHLAVQLHHEGDLDIGSLDPAIVPRFDAWLKFVEDKAPRICGFERPLYSRIYRYAGTPDLWCLMDGVLWLLDIKPNSLCKWYPIQLAAYQQLLRETGLSKEGQAKRATLQLKDDGTYKLTPYDRAQDAADMGVFLSLLSILNWRKRNECYHRDD